MKKILTKSLTGIVALHFAIVAYAASDEAKANYKAAKENAEATYKVARDKCNTLASNAKDVCIAEAKANENRSKANAEAQYENTPKARMKARIAAAEADYDVAKEKCNAHTGNAKDVCIKEAKAVYTKAKVDAQSSKEIGDIKSDAAHDKRDANYDVAIEKCDSLTGSAKDACVSSAKSKFGK
jgi:hypothetical protein